MFLPTLLYLSALGMPLLASANAEKAIFLGPAPVNLPQQSPSLADLHLDVLTPDDYVLRTHLAAVFPTDEQPRGAETWLLLDSLTEGQRYEVRVCWLATQPTAFHLETYPLDDVFDTPELITSLYHYSATRQEQQQQASPPSDPKEPAPSVADPSRVRARAGEGERDATLLLLRVSAAADYFTTNRTLMRHPEPVLVDLILDPFLLGVLPRTLLPTVGYVVLVAAASWVVAARLVMPWLRGMMVASAGGEKEDKKTQ